MRQVNVAEFQANRNGCHPLSWRDAPAASANGTCCPQTWEKTCELFWLLQR